VLPLLVRFASLAFHFLTWARATGVSFRYALTTQLKMGGLTELSPGFNYSNPSGNYTGQGNRSDLGNKSIKIREKTVEIWKP